LNPNENLYSCVAKCPYSLFADNSTGKCVEDCPEGYLKNFPTKECLLKCTSS